MKRVFCSAARFDCVPARARRRFQNELESLFAAAVNSAVGAVIEVRRSSAAHRWLAHALLLGNVRSSFRIERRVRARTVFAYAVAFTFPADFNFTGSQR